MTNFPNGITTDDITATGASATGTLKVGSAGDVITTIKTYTTAAANIAAANIVASKDQVVSTTSTGLTTTDKILSITPTNYVANQFVLGGTITAANNISISIFSAANVNAAAAQTFKVTVLR